MQLFAKINLPPIPAEFFSFQYIDPVYGILNTTNHMDYGYTHEFANQILPTTNQQVWTIRHPDYQSWLQSNIPVDGIDKLLCWSSMDGNPRLLPVHSDRSGCVSLNYIVNSGGTTVTTNWYQEKNQPLVRKPKKLGQQSDTGRVNYDDCARVDSVAFKSGEWAVLRVDVLHDVRDITGTRCIWSMKYDKIEMWDHLLGLD